MELRERPARAGLRCAYCHGAEDAAMDTCPRCGAVWHVGCRRELGACSTLGCAPGGPLAPPAPSRAPAGVVLGWAAAALQNHLLHQAQTPSDVAALALTSGLLTLALVAWLGRASAGWALVYVAAGWALCSSPILKGTWLAGGGAGLVVLVRRAVVADLDPPLQAQAPGL